MRPVGKSQSYLGPAAGGHGYEARVYERIKNANPIYLRELAEELRTSGAVPDEF